MIHIFYDFEFDGEKASDYGLIVGGFNGETGAEIVSSGNDISFNQVKASGSNMFLLTSSTYESPYTVTFQVVKNPCISNEIFYFSPLEISSIQRWLCKKNEYGRFKIFDNNFLEIYWNGTFSTKQINLEGRIVGLELTFIADSPYGYLDDITIYQDCSSATENTPYTFDLYDVSDEEGYIYLNMEITLLENSTNKGMIITNTMDNKQMKLMNCVKNEVIKIDGNNQIITSSVPSHNIPKDFNFIFPRIINNRKENKNTFSCNQKCIINISYAPIRKVGIC